MRGYQFAPLQPNGHKGVGGHVVAASTRVGAPREPAVDVFKHDIESRHARRLDETDDVFDFPIGDVG